MTRSDFLKWQGNYAWLTLGKQAGFSLLEIALGLMLLGMIGGMVLPFLMGQQQLRKNQLTAQNQERVAHSLALYVNFHGRLPCPGDPAAKGKERGIAPFSCSFQKTVGIVPYKTLGLPEQFAKDGYLNEFTYVAHPALIMWIIHPPLLKEDIYSYGFCAQICGKEDTIFLDVQEGETPSVQKNLQKGDVIAFVLISHGPSGEGAFQKGGGGSRYPLRQAGPCKRQNANEDFLFCAKPSSKETGLFDDRVKWETRYNFATYYMKEPCLPPKL
jgi:hypothetical protein